MWSAVVRSVAMSAGAACVVTWVRRVIVEGGTS